MSLSVNGTCLPRSEMRGGPSAFECEKHLNKTSSARVSDITSKTHHFSTRVLFYTGPIEGNYSLLPYPRGVLFDRETCVPGRVTSFISVRSRR